MTLKIGDTVTYENYGNVRSAIVTGVSRSGEIIFVKSDKGIKTFVHRGTITAPANS